MDITGYLDVFSSSRDTDGAQEAAHYACYVGRTVMGALFLAVPGRFDCRPGRSVPIALSLMLVGTAFYSLGAHQSLFSPLPVLVTGSALVGMGHIWMVSIVYLYMLRVLSRRAALWTAVAGQVAERMLTECLDAVLPSASLAALTYLLPVAASAAVLASDAWLARSRPARAESPGGPRALQEGLAGRYMLMLCVMVGVGLVACGAMSTVGIWGNPGSGRPAAGAPSLGLAAAESLLVVALARVTFIASMDRPLALRYQSSLLVLITGFALASVSRPVLAVPEQAAGVLLVAVENYAHVLFWAVVLDAAGSLRQPAMRSFGVGNVSCSMTGLLWSVFLEHGMEAAESGVFAAFYALVIVCVVYPQAFDRSSARSSSDAGALNAFAMEGEERVDPGVNGRELQEALERRCAFLAREHGLSAREGDVLVLLVKGETRQAMCAELGLSEGTVKTHLAHIYGKMGVHSQGELLEVAYRAEGVSGRGDGEGR